MHIIKLLSSSLLVSGALLVPALYAQDVEWDINDNFVGIGTGSPQARLHVFGDGGDEDAQVRVENANTAAPGAARKLFSLKNNGPAKFSIWASDVDEWAFNGRADAFRISKQGSGRVEMEVTDAGNLVIGGALTEGSSRGIKHDIVAVDPAAVLGKVLSLPVSTWSYNRDPEGVRHLGPMAEDFYRAFGLGATDRGIASVDTGGVALAAIKGLHAQLQDKSVQLARLQAENEALRAQLRQHDEQMLQFEMALAELARNQSGQVKLTASAVN